jgi:serine/threonine protein kinase
MIMSPVADGGDLDKFLCLLKAYQWDPRQHQEQITAMESVLKRAFGCLASGLAFIHRSKIRHKDIKTQNILLYNGRILYTDFGLAYHSSMFENSSTGGPTEMTRKYAAPEVLSGASRNSSSDVFSLGCVFIEMYSALETPIPSIDAPNFTFSASMSDIHRHLYHLNKGFETTPIPYAILWMTPRDPRRRWTALRLGQDLTMIPDYSCDDCASKEPNDPLQPAKTVAREKYLTKIRDLRFTMPLRGLASDVSPYQDNRFTDAYGPRAYAV